MGITKTKYPAIVWQPFEIPNNHRFRVLEPLESKNQRIRVLEPSEPHRACNSGCLEKGESESKYLRDPGISKGGTGDQRTTGSMYLKKDASQRTVGSHYFKPLEEPHWDFIKKNWHFFVCAVI
jgi:hypothetical protein